MINRKLIFSLLIVALAGGGVYLWNTRFVQEKVDPRMKPMVVEVVNTPHEKNVLVAPLGFPKDIPFEKNNIVQSSRTNYPEGDAFQASLTFESAKTPEDHYAAYLTYMKGASYAVTEGKSATGVLSLSGKKTGANLNIVLSRSASSTVVQISYLSFSR